MTAQGRAFTFNKKLWSIFLMKATTSAKLLLIAGIAIQSTALNAAPAENNNNSENSDDAVATSQAQEELLKQNSVLDESLSEQATLEQLEQENAALDAMLKEVTELKEISDDSIATNDEPDNLTDSVSGAMDDEQAESVEVNQTQALQPISEQETPVHEKEEAVEEEVASTANETMAEATDASQVVDEHINDAVSLDANVDASEPTSTAYNFERTPLGEGDIFIPIMADARVFAEFVDKFPAVVNYYTMASEQDVIDFYSESFGEPIEQDRKRQRLTLVYMLDGTTSRVVISQQDDKRQVDVIQEESM